MQSPSMCCGWVGVCVLGGGGVNGGRRWRGQRRGAVQMGCSVARLSLLKLDACSQRAIDPCSLHSLGSVGGCVCAIPAACVLPFVLCGCGRIHDRIFWPSMGGDGFQTQRKSWVSGQIRAEKVLADAITNDGRKEWVPKSMCGPGGVADDITLTSQLVCRENTSRPSLRRT